jgi:hypothetical protein
MLSLSQIRVFDVERRKQAAAGKKMQETVQENQSLAKSI